MTFDARHNERRIGRVAMGYGRDAVDVALTTTFGKHVLRKFEVWTDELPPSRRRLWSATGTFPLTESAFGPFRRIGPIKSHGGTPPPVPARKPPQKTA